MCRISVYITVLAAGISLIAPVKLFADDMKFVRLTQTQEIEVGKLDIDKVSFSSSSGGRYTVESFAIENRDGYKPGEQLNVSIRLKADSGSSFVDIKAGACLMDGQAAETAEVTENGTALSLTYKLPALHIKLAEPASLMLDRDGEASWTSVENADYYRVRLQKMNDTGGRTFVSNIKTRTPYIDLGEYIFAEPADYVYSVTSVSDRYYYDESDEAFLPVSESRMVTADDVGEDKNILDSGNGYARMDRQLVKNREIKIEGYWYFFGSDGKWVSGWNEDKNGWKYYEMDTHRRVKGLQRINGKEYYFDTDTGFMQTGFVETINGEQFFGSDGSASYGWNEYDGEVYYINSDGSKNSTMLIDDTGRTYIFHKDGRLVR